VSGTATGVAFLSALFALLALRVPIAVAMFATGAAGYVTLAGWEPLANYLKTAAYGRYSVYDLTVVPLFLLMGQFATKGGMSAALFRAASAWIGHKRGGVAMAAVGACAGFGAICGSSLATAATMGQVALPELKRHGYSDALATGALAAGGTLGILIPPSVVLVIYALLTEQNIAKLFVAAMAPGVLAMLGYMLTIALYVRLRPGAAGLARKADAMARRAALLAVWPVLAVFVVVIGGIYAGLFTPTEGAAVGAAGTGLIALARGGLGWRALGEALSATAVTTGMIFFIVLGAAVYNAFLASTQAPQTAAAWIGGLGFGPWTILTMILLAYLAFGCVMDSLSMILLTVPIFFPVVAALDFGLTPEETALWFGVLVLVVVEVGLITPPVGMNLFIINAMAGGAPLSATFRGAAPFVLSDIARVCLLVAFPAITLGLVRALF